MGLIAGILGAADALFSVVSRIWEAVGKRQKLLVITEMKPIPRCITFLDEREPDDFGRAPIVTAVVRGGRGPVTLMEVGCKTVGQTNLMVVVTPNKKLEQTESYSVFLYPEDVGNPEEIEYVFVRDTLRRVYKSKRFPFRGIKPTS